MKLQALRTTHIIHPNENLIKIIIETLNYNNIKLQNNCVLVLAETVVALCQNRIFDLNKFIKISPKAKKLAREYRMNEKIVEVIIRESDEIIGGIPGMLFTQKNQILIANAGLDKSNSGPEGIYSLWPQKPFETALSVREALCKEFNLKKLGIIISDSRVQPMRRGVVGVAIGVAGFKPVIDCRGRVDLFNYKMELTTRAIADQIADAAHIVMGECDEQTPFILIEDAPVEYCQEKIDSNDLIMPKKEDLFFRVFQNQSL